MKPLFFNVIKGLAVFCLCVTVLLFSFCFIALKTENPARYTLIFANAALLLSAFIGGRFSSGNEVSRLVSGIAAGLASMLIILLISLITSSFDSGSFLRMTLTVLIFILGALSKNSGTRTKLSARKRKSIAKRYSAAR